MRTARLALPAAFAGLLLPLSACGTVPPGGGAAGPAVPPVCGPGAPPSPAAEPGATASPGPDGVTVVGSVGGDRPCAAYSVTNRETEPFTYLVTLAFLSESGGAVTNVEETVDAVAPGRTVRRTVTAADLPPGAPRVARARVLTVRSFPTAEAPAEAGACPATGVRVYADDGDAAMGLRVVGLHLENCGTRPYRLDGYPRVEIRDEDHDRVDGVTITRGGETVAGGTGADGPARPVTLEPGERAHAGLVWRNTVEAGVGDPVNAPYARVWAKPGAAPVTVVPEFDIGTTGKLGVGPWKKDEPR
ncbi:DUF4232 domain-containing protein [Streptomyces sp. NPDC002057]|uniref:DUF4232 domain-containing protein n=1 Tax=Streptomyces sp. NPDC002057 TaxID=3154664 RepID=UPI003316BE2E